MKIEVILTVQYRYQVHNSVFEFEHTGTIKMQLDIYENLNQGIQIDGGRWLTPPSLIRHAVKLEA